MQALLEQAQPHLVDAEEAYDQLFEPIIARHDDETETLPKVGQGYYANVYGFAYDNQDYVLREPISDSAALSKAKAIVFMRDSVAAAIAREVESNRASALIGFQPEQSRSVHPWLSGITRSAWTVDLIDDIPSRHLNELFDLLNELMSKGVSFDNVGENLLYCQDEGFGVVDLKPAPEDTKDSDILYHMYRAGVNDKLVKYDPTVAAVAAAWAQRLGANFDRSWLKDEYYKHSMISPARKPSNIAVN